MGENRSLLTTLGSILGLVLFIFVIMQAVNYFRAGTAEFDEMQRQAGAPVLLSETLHESADTEEGAAAESAPAEAAVVDATTEVTTTDAVTTTDVVATDAVTESAAITATEAITTSEEVSATEDAAVDASAAVTETTAAETTATETTVEATPALTTTESVTTTEVITESEAATAGGATEAPVEEVALVVPTPDEVAPIFTKAGCIGCHVIPEIPNAVGAVGPNLTGIGTTAATRVEGLDAQAYLHQSILEPNAFIVPECPTGPCLPGLMVQNLGDVLTPEEIDMVVAYLASLVEE